MIAQIPNAMMEFLTLQHQYKLWFLELTQNECQADLLLMFATDKAKALAPTLVRPAIVTYEEVYEKIKDRLATGEDAETILREISK